MGDAIIIDGSFYAPCAPSAYTYKNTGVFQGRLIFLFFHHVNSQMKLYKTGGEFQSIQLLWLLVS
jgi:hypothetical protein